jgi:nitroreductase
MTFSSFKDLVRSNRSCRRFDNSQEIDKDTLKDLVDLARNSASGKKDYDKTGTWQPKKNPAGESCLPG